MKNAHCPVLSYSAIWKKRALCFPSCLKTVGVSVLDNSPVLFEVISETQSGVPLTENVIIASSLFPCFLCCAIKRSLVLN
jgi:hypothetical protein